MFKLAEIIEMKINIQGEEIEYEIIMSRRACSVKLSVSCAKGVSIILPVGFGENFAERFLLEKSDWVLRKMKEFSKLEGKRIIKTNRKEYLKHKEAARKLVHQRILFYNQFYKFKFNRISIKNQKTLWGSCSQNGNLNFNYILALVPLEISDYIIVHEICHLWEFNHSREFWRLVSLTIPNYREIRKEVKNIYFG